MFEALYMYCKILPSCVLRGAVMLAVIKQIISCSRGDAHNEEKMWIT